ncbi:MAG: DUF3592 domain-containing protein [Clostridiales bacterium]|nr:DUF3592 domain-containing protein [Clostridiales bacterium]
MKKTKNVFIICESIFSIVACVFLVVSICLIVNGRQFEKNGKKTTATIVDSSRVKNYRNGKNYRKGKDTSSVTIVYEVEGTPYVKTIHEYSSSWSVGDELDIYYDSENPLKVRIKSMLYFLPIMFGIFGVVLLIPAIILEIKRRGSKKKQMRLTETGKKVYATVNEVIENSYVRVNGRHPYQAIAIYTDEYSGMTYQFKSRNFWDDFINIIGRQVPVYYDPKNPMNYYVDIESLFNVKCEL